MYAARSTARWRQLHTARIDRRSGMRQRIVCARCVLRRLSGLWSHIITLSPPAAAANQSRQIDDALLHSVITLTQLSASLKSSIHRRFTFLAVDEYISPQLLHRSTLMRKLPLVTESAPIMSSLKALSHNKPL